MSLAFSTLPALDGRSLGAADLVVLPYWPGVLEQLRSLPADTVQNLRQLLDHDHLPSAVGDSALLVAVAGLGAARLLIVRCADQAPAKIGDRARALAGIASATAAQRATSATVLLDVFATANITAAALIEAATLAFRHAAYRYQATVKPKKPVTLTQVQWLIHSDDASAAIERAQAVANGIELTRELGDLPPNLCPPARLVDAARALTQQHDSLTVDVLDREQMQALGMGALLAVARGSAQPPYLIVVEHRPAHIAADSAPVVLVGKGITFDTGGISIKPAEAMDEMKYDMCGAASVLGTLKAVAGLKLEKRVIGIVAAVENMPDGNAYRPGDVLTTMSGRTVEVLNTDAEGRLILCDALTYARRYKPAVLIDIATLTGACVVALGNVVSGLMSHHDELAEALIAAGARVHDRAWRLPIYDDYKPLLDSPFADSSNLGGRWAGAITAGLFLAQFTDGLNWAHLDIAGTAWADKRGGATGRPVSLLVEYLRHGAG